MLLKIGDKPKDQTASFGSQSIKGVELCLRNITSIQSDISLSTNFTRRGFCNVQITDKSAVVLAFKTFGNIGDNGNSRSADLITQSIVTAKSTLVRSLINQLTQFTPFLPPLYLLESFNFRQTFPQLSTFNLQLVTLHPRNWQGNVPAARPVEQTVYFTGQALYTLPFLGCLRRDVEDRQSLVVECENPPRACIYTNFAGTRCTHGMVITHCSTSYSVK